jgi:hypothetical protein
MFKTFAHSKASLCHEVTRVEGAFRHGAGLGWKMLPTFTPKFHGFLPTFTVKTHGILG